MNEWSEEQLKNWMADGNADLLFIYFYTPLCGTCKMTERMLQVILALDPGLPIVKSNVNFSPQLAREWQIESVPCLAGVKSGGSMHKRYRMQAVDDLRLWFKQMQALSGQEALEN